MNKLVLMNQYQKRINQQHLHMHLFDSSYTTEHVHQTWELTLITEGKVIHVLNGKEQILQKGDVILLRPGDQHHFADFENYSSQHLCIQIVDDDANKYMSLLDDGLYDYLFSKSSRQLVLPPTEFNYILRQSKTAIKVFDGDLRAFLSQTKVIIFHFLHQFLLDMKSEATAPFWLTEFIQKIQNLPNYNIQVKELASLTVYSYTHLRRLFKQYMNTTLAEYFTRIKLNRAQMMLKETSMKIIDIAGSLGYYSLSHFNKLFQLYNGVTPSKYRTAYKQSPPPIVKSLTIEQVKK